ncbi:MAG: hypothetical protein QXR60_03820 [Candidatus Nanoarchaeia archaeon]
MLKLSSIVRVAEKIVSPYCTECFFKREKIKMAYFKRVMQLLTVGCLCVLFFLAGIRYGVQSEYNRADDYVEWACGKYAAYYRTSTAFNFSGPPEKVEVVWHG